MRFARVLAPLMLLASLATPAVAAGTVSGTFDIITSESDNVEKAIETTVAPMNFVIRGIAKGRLQKVNQPYQHMTLNVGSKISIATDGREAINGANGSTFKWTRPEDGEKLDVTLRSTGGSLEETFASSDGKRVNVFTPSADGKKLTMSVTVTSGKLPKPLTYKLVYKRSK